MNKNELDLMVAALRTAGFQIDNLAVELFLEITALVKQDFISDNETTIKDITGIKMKIEKRYQEEAMERQKAAMPGGIPVNAPLSKA